MKFKVHTHVYSYGIVDDIETAKGIAEMVIEEENKRVVFISNASTNELIETIENKNK